MVAANFNPPTNKQFLSSVGTIYFSLHEKYVVPTKLEIFLCLRRIEIRRYQYLKPNGLISDTTQQNFNRNVYYNGFIYLIQLAQTPFQ